MTTEEKFAMADKLFADAWEDGSVLSSSREDFIAGALFAIEAMLEKQNLIQPEE